MTTQYRSAVDDILVLHVVSVYIIASVPGKGIPGSWGGKPNSDPSPGGGGGPGGGAPGGGTPGGWGPSANTGGRGNACGW